MRNTTYEIHEGYKVFQNLTVKNICIQNTIQKAWYQMVRKKKAWYNRHLEGFEGLWLCGDSHPSSHLPALRWGSCCILQIFYQKKYKTFFSTNPQPWFSCMPGLPACQLSPPARQRWSGTCPAGTSDSCSPAPAPWSAPPTPRHLSPRSPSWKKNIWNLCRLGGEYHQTCCLFRPRQTGSDMSRYFGKSTDIS